MRFISWVVALVVTSVIAPLSNIVLLAAILEIFGVQGVDRQPMMFIGFFAVIITLVCLVIFALPLTFMNLPKLLDWRAQGRVWHSLIFFVAWGGGAAMVVGYLLANGALIGLLGRQGVIQALWFGSFGASAGFCWWLCLQALLSYREGGDQNQSA